MNLDFLIRCLPTRLRSRWGFDANEQEFFSTISQSVGLMQSSDGPRMLLQMPTDYFCLSLFTVAVMQLRPSLLVGLWHQNIMSAPRAERFQEGRRLLRRIFNLLDRLKWQRLYAVIGVERYCSLEVGVLTALRHAWLARSIWRGLSSKEELLGLVLRGTHCGDLIYDTYLRYRVQPTLDLDDPYLCTIITQALNAQTAMRRLLAVGEFEIFLTSYTSYVQHGIPVREALRVGVNVYSSGNLSQYFKRLDLDDVLHTAAHWRYLEQFESLPKPSTALEQARQQLESRFKGGVDQATLYMKTSAFLSSDALMPEGVEAVVFLHDFFDSPHCHRNMLFVDFLEWANFTLGVIQKYDLPIAVKPHPNQLEESREVVLELQRMYPEVKWLPVTLSNRTIFNSGIKCGISVYGTILHELAYHGIPALAAGDHPHTAFGIAITPDSIESYERSLRDFRTLPLTTDVQKQVLSFYYMHNLYNSEGLALDFCGQNLRDIDVVNSSGLQRFMTMYPRFLSLLRKKHSESK